QRQGGVGILRHRTTRNVARALTPSLTRAGSAKGSESVSFVAVRSAVSEPDRVEHGPRHLVAALGEQRGALDVDAVALLTVDPRVPRTAADRVWVAIRGDACAQVRLQLAHLGLAADRSVAGHDHVGEAGDDVERVGP